MGQITKFVTQYGTYTFPTTAGDQDYRDNFASLMGRSVRLPGGDGGFDQLGDGRGLSAVGVINLEWYLVSDTREGMQTLRWAARKMMEWGVGRLYFQPTDTNLGLWWTWARPLTPNMPEERHRHSDLFQRVQMTFEASEPAWTINMTTAWGGGWLWGGGQAWGAGTPTTVTGSGTLSLTNNGSIYAQPTISLKVPVGYKCGNPTFRRVVGGAVVEQVGYVGTLVAGDYLFIDCGRLGVWVNGVKQYSTAFQFQNSNWLRLTPGSNTVKVLFGTTTDRGDVLVNHLRRDT